MRALALAKTYCLEILGGRSGGAAPPAGPSGDALLREASGYILREGGGYILLEG